jgi:hypothetical protein
MRNYTGEEWLLKREPLALTLENEEVTLWEKDDKKRKGSLRRQLDRTCTGYPQTLGSAAVQSDQLSEILRESC